MKWTLKEMAELAQQTRKIIHCDMDYFYAQVEIRDNPKLQGKPLVISGPPNTRSVICTANYEARKLGIHAGMSANVAKKKYNDLIYIIPNFKKYIKASNKMHEIFHRYTDIIEPLSLDEAYLDVTNNKIGSKSAVKIARMIQRDIKNELNLTCSLGVSYNKFLAKVGSDFKKPYRITVITPDDAHDFISELDIKDFPGVGKKSILKYHDYGIYKGSDLIKYSKEDLIKTFGKIGESLYERVRGIDECEVVKTRKRKSYGKEETYQQNLKNFEEISKVMYKYCEQISEMLLRDKKLCFTINIKLRFKDFKTITRSHSIKIPINKTQDIYKYAVELLEANYHHQEVRLAGVSVSNIVDDQDDKIYYEQIYLKL